MHGQSVVRVQDVELVSEDLEKFDDAQLHIPAPEYPIRFENEFERSF